uniref:Cysteine dioxygenase n=1 Tax=Panagrellus redivivus TaxID=6233 RepID=A0A7E4UQR0_PANRE
MMSVRRTCESRQMSRADIDTVFRNHGESGVMDVEKSTKEHAWMEKLISEVQDVFKNDHINTEDLKYVLQNYKSNPCDWKKYANFDAHKYTRNLVDIGNGKYNMMILCWGPGMSSSIHDHTNSHCFVKILDGSLCETRFAWPETEGKDAPLQKLGETLCNTDDVTYMSDEIGLHRMENPSHSDGCVSLHIYIPAYDNCQVFDERTGRHTKAVVTFYTKFGRKVDYRHSRQGILPPPDAENVNRSQYSPY